jgi:hypothetical protein
MLKLSLGNRLDQLRASRWAKPIGLVWLIACLVAGGYCFTRQAADATTSAAPRHVTQAIETIRVGERVVTPETIPGFSLPTAVDPATWRLVSLRMLNRWADGTADTMLVQTVQPPQWLSEHQVKVGARVPIPLDLKEMGVEDQLAEVTAVSACPPIETGPGRVVLTTVNHLNSFLFDLTVQGERAPPSQITVTGWHKLYSEDRAAWVSVCELKIGEKMRGRDGPLTVASLVRHAGTETVYNMTVEGEHQYYVADAELLAHNADCTKRFSDEKSALVDMAKGDKRTGISEGDMQAYKDLNKELPDPFPSDMVRGPESHSAGAPSSQAPHGHVGPVDHIPIN